MVHCTAAARTHTHLPHIPCVKMERLLVLCMRMCMPRLACTAAEDAGGCNQPEKQVNHECAGGW